MRAMSEKQSNSGPHSPVWELPVHKARSLEDRQVPSPTTGARLPSEPKPLRNVESYQHEPMANLCRACINACLETARHCARKLESGNARYLPLLHAAVECHDTLHAYWADLMGPAGSLREMAERCCASASSACSDAAQQCEHRDRVIVHCQAVCVAVSNRLANSGEPPS